MAPAGSHRVATTSRDNTLRIWDGAAALAAGLVMRHNNNTGRWVIPFRAVWTAASDGLICGGMGRTVSAAPPHTILPTPPSPVASCLLVTLPHFLNVFISDCSSLAAALFCRSTATTVILKLEDHARH